MTTSLVDVTGYRISPDGRTVVFSALAFPECKTLACSADRRKARGEDKAEGEVYDRLGVRFWDTFGDGRYNHLFAQPVAGGEAVPADGRPDHRHPLAAGRRRVQLRRSAGWSHPGVRRP